MSKVRRRRIGAARLGALALIGWLLDRRKHDGPVPQRPRMLARAPVAPRVEVVVAMLFVLSSLCACGFLVALADRDVPDATQLLGLTLAGALLALAGAFTLIGRRLVTGEEVEHDYPPTEQQTAEAQFEQLVSEAGEGFTRRRLLGGTGALAGGALGVALLGPLTSLGPVFDLASFVATPWFRGRRLVGVDGAPLHAEAIEEAAFYTAYPEGADREQLGAPLIVVRLPRRALRLPRGRTGWAPDGIVAYSKICTHAGCAISLYRTPTFVALEPGPALVCPCHYSTFDPATGGTVLFGPAGRPLPQLPLQVDAQGILQAAGTFSGPVGPAWWGVRSRRPT